MIGDFFRKSVKKDLIFVKNAIRLAKMDNFWLEIKPFVFISLYVKNESLKLYDHEKDLENSINRINMWSISFSTIRCSRKK